MSQIPNSIGISAPIAPFDSEDIYPTHFAKYGKGGYFSVNTLDELNSYPAERLEEGSLAFVVNTDLPGEDGKFYLREGLTWKEIDVFNPVPEVDLSSLNILPPGEIAPEDIPEFLERVDRGSKYIVYVDPNHLNATDAKTNKGNSPLRPFKTIERACLEAARKSFKAGGSNLNPNDFTEKVSIYLAPATYYVNNGRGGVAEDNLFHVRQDASNLIFANKKWLIDRAYAAAAIEAYIDGLAGLTLEQKEGLKIACKRDLNIYISSIANDISLGGNINTVTSANTIKPDGVYISAYDTIDERQKTVSALNSIKSDIRTYVLNNTADTVGGVALSDIILEGDSNGTNRCIAVKDSVDTLLDILIDTLNITEYVAPALEDANRGTLELGFPDTGEPSDTNLQGFNSAYNAGIILPRGISIVGADLRKVVIRPKYVPNKNGEEGSSAIFRMTGANFFSGFTIKDKEGLEESHHKLSCFEFCDDTDLNEYYDKVATVFKDNKQFNLLFDSSNLILYNSLWVNRKLSELDVDPDKEPYKEALLKKIDQITYSISADLRDQTDRRFKELSAEIAEEYTSSFTDKVTEAENYYPIIDYIYEVLVDVISNRAVVVEGGFINPSVPIDTTNPTNPCQEVQSIILNFLEILKDSLAGQLIVDAFSPNDVYANNDVESTTPENQIVGPLGTNTVDGASPYIFSASLRSVYGMNGIDGNGSVVSGFKSYLAAQFTVISIQKDTDAFYPIVNAGEVANKRYKGTRYDDFVGLEPRGDWRHFGYKVTDEAYAQLVSCFCIGPAVHYWADSGAEFSITNSTSNFGDVSIQAYGYVGQDGDGGAYVQDKGYKWTAVKPPSLLPVSEDSAKTFSVGTFLRRTSNSIILENPIGFDNLQPYTLKPGSRIYLRRLTGDELNPFVELHATIDEPGAYPPELDDPIQQVSVIPISSFSSGWPDIDSSDEAIILGGGIYIKRIVDTRNKEDKIHKLIVQAPSESRGKPLENFIFRLKKTETQDQFPYQKDNVFFVASSNVYDETNNLYEITLLNAYKDDEGNSDNNILYYPELDLDYDPISQTQLIITNPTDSLTYKTVLSIVNFVQESSTLLSLSNSINSLSSGDIDVEFNKPTTVRCGGQTWEYLGYYNYDTSIPALQASQIGSGLTVDEKVQFVLNKLQNQKYGGKIYATGLDEEGNFYVGTRVFNVKTGEESDLRLGGTEESTSKSFAKLTVAESLQMLSGSDLRISGDSTLKFDSGALLDIVSTEVKSQGYTNAQGLEISELGFSRPATLKEITNEIELQSGQIRGNAYVTPQGLASWRQARQLVSLRTGVTRVYIGTWFNTNPVGISSGYYNAFWPEPPFPQVPESSNPGLIFRPFNSFASAATWCNTVLSLTETVELYVAPGRYSMSATFNCNVILNGANGVGSYGAPDDPLQSVIFYRNIRVSISRNNAGEAIPGGINLGNETLRIKGTGTSKINRVFFENPIDSFNKRRTTPIDSGTSPIEHLIKEVLKLQYRNTFENIFDYVQSIDEEGNAYYFDGFYNPNPCIAKESGELELFNVVFYPQGITRSDPLSAYSSNSSERLSSIISTTNTKITLNGCSIRGVGLFSIPRSIFSDVLEGNPNDYSIVNDINELPSWSSNGYFSTFSGDYSDSSVGTHITLFGTAHTFISLGGTSDIRWCNAGFRQNNNPTRPFNYNDDRNNFRLEKTHYSIIDFDSTPSYGDTYLGTRGTISISSANGQDFVNELKTSRGPMFNAIYYIAQRNSDLDSDGYLQYNSNTPTQNSGFKGEFSYIPIINNYNLGLGYSIRPVGLAFNRNLSLSKCSIWASSSRALGSAWRVAGTSYTLLLASNKLNIYSVYLIGGTYNAVTFNINTTSPSLSNSLLNNNNELVVSQRPGGVNTDPTLLGGLSSRDPRNNYNYNDPNDDPDQGTITYDGFGNIINTTQEYNSRYIVYGLFISTTLVI